MERPSNPPPTNSASLDEQLSGLNPALGLLFVAMSWLFLIVLTARFVLGYALNTPIAVPQSGTINEQIIITVNERV